MLGPPKRRRLDEPIAISLEALVPQGHFYCHLEAKLDLSFVREWIREHYAERDCPSIDPVVFFELHLIMFFEGFRSERQLIATASLNLAHHWYLGYALDEPFPDHSNLTRIRQRLDIDIRPEAFSTTCLVMSRAMSRPSSSSPRRMHDAALSSAVVVNSPRHELGAQ